MKNLIIFLLIIVPSFVSGSEVDSNIQLTVTKKIIQRLNDSALIAYTNGELDHAQKNLITAISKQRDLTNSTQDLNSVNLAILLTNLGFIYREIGKREEAESLFFEVLEIPGLVDKIALGNLSLFFLLEEYLKDKGLHFKSHQISQRILDLLSQSVSKDTVQPDGLPQNQQRQLIVNKITDELQKNVDEFYLPTITPDNFLKSIRDIHSNKKIQIAELVVSQHNNLWEQANVKPWIVSGMESIFQTVVGIAGSKSEEAIEKAKKLSWVYMQSGMYQKAETLLLKYLGYTHDMFGQELPLAGVKSDLARLYVLQNKLEDAHSLYAQALEIYERFLPHKNLVVSRSLVNFAGINVDLGRYKEAKNLYLEALDIQKIILPETSTEKITTLLHIAEVSEKLGEANEAIAYYRKATDLAVDYFLLVSVNDDSLQPSSLIGYPRSFTLKHLNAYLNLNALKVNDQLTKDLNMEYVAMQLSKQVPISHRLENMVLQHAVQDTELGGQIRERMQVAEKFVQLQEKITFAGITNVNQEKNIANRKEIAILKRQFSEIDQAIKLKYPEFHELMIPEPLTLTETQKLLNSNEALITYLVGDANTFVFVVNRNNVTLHRLNIGQLRLDNLVQTLRSSLDPSFMNIEMSDTGNPKPSTLTPYDVDTAYLLYQSLIEPIVSDIEKIDHLIIVPDDSLNTLPFPALISQPVNKPIGKFEFSRYQALSWLNREYAMSTLPTVSSLRALRQKAKFSMGNIPFVGFGDPLLEGRSGATRTMAVQDFVETDSVNFDVLKTLPALPNTKKELFQIAYHLDSSTRHVFTGKQATETRIKSMNMTKYKIIGFSTHALLSSNTRRFNGIEEPALVFTPPTEPTPLDDGLLTASEIALLGLDADWVILAACNTAAGKQLSGSGLSGLVRSFFYAGSRSLLITHWNVETIATEKIVTSMFEKIASNQNLQRSEALRLATMAFLEKNRHFAHPTFWAPFFIAGEGGLLKQH